MYDKTQDMASIKHAGSLKIINSATNKSDGFRLYTCVPVHHDTEGRVVKILDPEIRFKANKKFNGKSVGLAIQQKNSPVCFQIIMNIINKTILDDIQLAQHKHKSFINQLWNGLTYEHKLNVIKAIYEKKPFLLSSKESVSNTIIEGNNAKEFFNIVCHNFPIATPSTVPPEHASRIIFINADVYAKRQGKESVSAYTTNHPDECCIVHNRSALENVLKLHEGKDQTITLVIFADNNVNKEKTCLDWTLETVGNKLGQIVKAHPCIGHLNLFTCYSGSLDVTRLEEASCFEKSDGAQDLSRSLSVYPKSSLPENNPFEIGTIAHQICQIIFPAIHEKKRGPVAISASPRYIHCNESRFIGSSEGTPYYQHRFFTEESPLLHYKRITAFIGEPLLFEGICLSKSIEQKNSHYQVTLAKKDTNIAPQDNGQLLPYSFFKRSTKESAPNTMSKHSLHQHI